jgi:hypothetical protein
VGIATASATGLAAGIRRSTALEARLSSFEPRPGVVISAAELGRLMHNRPPASYIRHYMAKGHPIRLLAPSEGRDQLFVATFVLRPNYYEIVSYGHLRGIDAQHDAQHLPSRRPFLLQEANKRASYLFGIVPGRFSRAIVSINNRVAGRATIRARGFFIRVPLHAKKLRVVLKATSGKDFSGVISTG